MNTNKKQHSHSVIMEIRILLFLSIFYVAYSSPLQRDNDPYSREKLQERLKRIQGTLEEGRDSDTDGEYTRYLKELMANHPELADQFNKIAPEEIAKRFGGRFAQKNKNVRSQIDELQRMNLDRMRQFRNGASQNQRSPYNDPKFRQDRAARPEDIESRVNDFNKIQKELDEIRKERFHSFEKKVEDARIKKIKEMDEAHRLKEEERLEALAKQHKEHEKMRYPASKKQLEDVWVNQDGLKDEPFDAKTFFYMHDKDGDGSLDFYEIEALFINEIRKVYGDNTDGMVVEEELNEMREHVFQEVDTNSDGFVSLSEFMAYTNDQKFNNEEEWKPLEERDKVVISPEDMDLTYDYGDEDYHYDELKNQQTEEDNQRHPTEGVPLDHDPTRGTQEQAQGQEGAAAHPTPADHQPQGDTNKEESKPTEAQQEKKDEPVSTESHPQVKEEERKVESDSKPEDPVPLQQQQQQGNL